MCLQVAAALFTSAKYHERNSLQPCAEEICWAMMGGAAASRSTCNNNNNSLLAASKKALLAAEMQLLRAVGYELHHPTTCNFLPRLLKAAGALPDCTIDQCAQMFSDLVLLDKQLLEQYSYKEQAAAIVYCALVACNQSQQIPRAFFQYADIADLGSMLGASRRIVQQLLLLLADDAAVVLFAAVVKKKYSRTLYSQVAQMMQLPVAAALMNVLAATAV